MIETDKLKEHHKNGYYFTDVEGEKYEEIRRSIEENGIRDPIKITMDYTVISGHQRLRIARDVEMERVPVTMVPDLTDAEAEYLLIAENVERRGQAETDPIKKSRIANFLKEYWEIERGNNQYRMVNNSPSSKDVADAIGESVDNTKRILKLNDLIPELQELVSEGKLGQTAGEQLAHLTEDNQRALLSVLGEEVKKTTVANAKEYREVEESSGKDNNFDERLEQLKKEKESECKERERLEKEIEELNNKPPEVKEVEVVPDDILEELEKYKNDSKELQEYREKHGSNKELERKEKELNDNIFELEKGYGELMRSYDMATLRTRLVNSVSVPFEELEKRKTEMEQLMGMDIELDNLTINILRSKADTLKEVANTIYSYLGVVENQEEKNERIDVIDVIDVT